MKKFLSYAFVGAIALAGAFMVSCSSDDSVAVENNPTFDGAAVKTQFTIALPSTAKTRMTAENVQKDGNFLGIKNIKLIPFATKPTAGTETLNGAIVELSNIAALDMDHGNSKVYNDVAINTGTKFFLFYGQANKDDGFDNGKLATAAAADITKPSDITFTPVQILTATGT